MSRPSSATQAGFSAVKLLITLFVGFLFISMGFQLYSVMINRGNNQGDLAIANTYVKTALEAATNFMYPPDQPYACPTAPAQYTQFAYTLDGNTYDARIYCPNPTDLPNLRMMTLYYKYKTAEAVDARYFLQQ